MLAIHCERLFGAGRDTFPAARRFPILRPTGPPGSGMVHQWVTGSGGCGRRPAGDTPRSGAALWGLAGWDRLDPSHPSIVARHVTILNHAPFSRAPRVRSRLGVVQNQRFSGPHAHNCALMGKLAEKPGKNRQKRDAKWRKSRLFEGPKRHFALPGADGSRSQPAILTDFTSEASVWIELAAAPEIGGRAPFFTCVGQAFQPDIRGVRLESLTYTGFG